MNDIPTDEDFFHDLLDDNELDHCARHLLAEWLAERGDVRAAGYSWLSRRLIVPQDYKGTRTWDWNDALCFDRLTGAIPHDLFLKLDSGHLASSGHYREYPTRRDAEDALCAALRRPAPPPGDDEPALA